jgi:hypothetical protein
MTERMQDGRGGETADLDQRVDAINESGGFDDDDRQHRRTLIEAKMSGYEDDDE